MILELVIPGNPIPAYRPRLGRLHVFNAQPYVDWKDMVIAYLTTSRIRFEKGRLLLEVAFYRKNQIRVDFDNLVKGVMDALTQADVIHDDSDIKRAIIEVDYDKENPRTWIRLQKLEQKETHDD